MIVGPVKALFMDEISNGLDSSTTFQIMSCMQHLAHITDATVLISLLQPAPETFDLFDDIILMAEGKIVYHGPRSTISKFFEDSGFRCPERKGIADFLQEVSLSFRFYLHPYTMPKRSSLLLCYFSAGYLKKRSRAILAPY
jgi:ABC-type multidrug transport system ATPase subunit